MKLITVFFGQFGSRNYIKYRTKDYNIGAAQIDCRWCIGENKPLLNCSACKNTRRMWISI